MLETKKMKKNKRKKVTQRESIVRSHAYRIRALPAKLRVRFNNHSSQRLKTR